MQSKFPLSLNPAEPPTLTDAIDYRVLLPRLLALIGLDMSPSATVAFNADPNSFQFVVSDFPTELRAVFKQMNIAEQSQALELLYQAIEHPLSQVRRRLFELAGSKIQRAIARAPSSNTGLLVLGSLLL
ncbi:MAG: hypothetical protein Q8P67_16060, partial [archaeon]|nr:hypothetical protein [archaeon]